MGDDEDTSLIMIFFFKVFCNLNAKIDTREEVLY